MDWKRRLRMDLEENRHQMMVILSVLFGFLVLCVGTFLCVGPEIFVELCKCL